MFDYKSLAKKTVNGKRLYTTPSGNLPSVTTILDRTSDKSFLDAWKKRVGEEEAKKQVKEASGLGTAVHNYLESHLLQKEIISGSNYVHQLAKKLAEELISCHFSSINTVWGTEVSLYYPDLYAGTCDCVGIVDNKPTIIDFKTAKKIKKKEWIENYFLQCCAYAKAHNCLFDTNIQNCSIFMVDREGNTKRFDITGDEFETYCMEWNQRLISFYNINTKLAETDS